MDVKNKIVRGTFGKIWVNNELMANVKSFEAKITMNYEEVDINGNLAKQHRYTGYSIAGTMVLHKIDTHILNTVASGIVSGSMPSIKIVGALADPDSNGAERIEVFDVSFDEAMLLQFENGAIGEESVPFKAGGFNLIDTID